MQTQPDSTGITLATWIYALHRLGGTIAAAPVASACRAVDADGAAAAPALLAAVRTVLTGDAYTDVVAAVNAVLGVGATAAVGAGADAESRAGALRRASFGDNRPWIAALAERRDGVLGEHLALVAAFGDTVTLLDPNPWDDVAEERTLPLAEFLVRWELAGAQALRAVG